MKPKLFSIIKHANTELSGGQLTKDIISGIIVAIIALPLSVALAISSGVTPDKGLVTAIIAGFLISFLGGSRVQIGGPTGAFVIIVYGIIEQYGVSGLTIATIMAGIFMIFFGLMKFGSIIKYVPYPTTTGFTAGIAVTLLSTQVNDFFGLGIKNVPSEFFEKWSLYIENFSKLHLPTFLIGLFSILVIVLWPKINKTIPGSLIALIASTAIVALFDLPVETIGSRFGEISSKISLIDFGSFQVTVPLLKDLIRPAITIAFLASIESLLSAVVADGMIGKKHNSNMELVAQGIANIGSALFGGIPATGAIARTAANIKNGGRTPVSGIVHALVLLLIMKIFMPLASLVPMTSLAAILVVVAYNMSEWRACKALLKSTKSDIAVLASTFLFTVIFDLVVAIEIGMVIAMFLFVKRMADSIHISEISNTGSVFSSLTSEEEDESYLENDLHKNLKKEVFLYEINGPLFFGAANKFLDVMNEIDRKSSVIILKMKNVPNMDATAFDALKRIQNRCREKHILLLYAEINDQPMKLLTNTGFVAMNGEDRFFSLTEDAIRKANEIIECKQTSRTIRAKINK